MIFLLQGNATPIANKEYQYKKHYDTVYSAWSDWKTYSYKDSDNIQFGKTATKEDANETIKWIREEIQNLYGKDVANSVIIQYGGSVKSTNANDLFEMKLIYEVFSYQ